MCPPSICLDICDQAPLAHQIHRGDTAALRHFVDFLRHDGVIRSKKVVRAHEIPRSGERHTPFRTPTCATSACWPRLTITYYVMTFVREFSGRSVSAGAASRSPASVPARIVVRCVHSGKPRGCT